MKRKITLLLILGLILIAFIIKKNIVIENKTKENEITLAEVTHSPFYAPLYVAIEKGYFKKNGINLKLILTSGADKVSSAVLSSDAQIGLAGAESALYIYENKEKDYLQIFSGLTKRDGQFIVSRNKEFSLTDLYGKKILVGRKSGMPALNFINALEKNNIDKNKIDIDYSVDFAALSGAFIGNNGDFVNLFEPNANMLEKQKLGNVVESIGKLSGEMPYTTFYCKKSYIKKNKEVITSFIKSINEGLKYVENTSAKIIANDIINQFPDTSKKDLEIIIKRYKENDTWQKDSIITQKQLDNLEDLLIKNKLIKSYIPYKKIIINNNE